MPILIIILGATCFWGPVILLFAIAMEDATLILANVLSICLSLCCYFLLTKGLTSRAVAGWMLLGVYSLGPVLLNVANAFGGGGFSQTQSWGDIGWLLSMSIFPPLLFLFASNSGLFPSMLVITTFLLYAAVRKNWGQSRFSAG